MNNETTKSMKTGATPIIEEGLGGGEVLGVMEVKTVLVRFRDGHGREETKLAVIIPGGETYFFGRGSVDDRPAQTWLKEGINRKLK